jgi:putative flippase GtrA
MRLRPLLISFLKFGGLSGLGWLADACILLVLVGYFGMTPLVANFISSCTAALAVFLISRELIFSKASGRTGLRVFGYLAYVLALICVASVMAQLISTWVLEFSETHRLAVSATLAAAVAKVIITPPQLVSNFLVSRAMSERKLGGRHAIPG